MDKPISIRKVKTMWISLCTIFTVVCIMLISFQYQANSQSQKKLKQEAARLIELEKEAKDFQDLIQRYQDERARFATVLFTEKDIAEFLNKISDFARDSGIRIKSMEAQQMSVVQPLKDKNLDTGSLAIGRHPLESKKQGEETGPSLVFLPINLAIEGRFEPVIEFLISLEKYRQLLTLSNVSIRRQQAYPLLDCKFVLRLYTLKQMEEFVK